MMSAESNSEMCPSFFWYDNDKDLKVCFLVTRVILLIHPDFRVSSSLDRVTIRFPRQNSRIIQGYFENLPMIFKDVKTQFDAATC